MESLSIVRRLKCGDLFITASGRTDLYSERNAKQVASIFCLSSGRQLQGYNDDHYILTNVVSIDVI